MLVFCTIIKFKYVNVRNSYHDRLCHTKRVTTFDPVVYTMPNARLINLIVILCFTPKTQSKLIIYTIRTYFVSILENPGGNS